MVPSLLYTEWKIQDQSSGAMALLLDCEIHIILCMGRHRTNTGFRVFEIIHAHVWLCCYFEGRSEGVRQTQLMQTRRAPANVNGSLVNDKWIRQMELRYLLTKKHTDSSAPSSVEQRVLNIFSWFMKVIIGSRCCAFVSHEIAFSKQAKNLTAPAVYSLFLLDDMCQCAWF